MMPFFFLFNIYRKNCFYYEKNRTFNRVRFAWDN